VQTQHIIAAAATKPWTAHDTRLMVAAVIGIAIIVLLIVLAKVHPFLALVLGSAFVGLASGVGLKDVIGNFEDGVGNTLREVGLLIALGAMLGKLLADSGGADRIIDTLLARASAAKIPWAMALVAIIIGLPMFFEIGLVLLLPVIVLVSQRSGLKTDARRHPRPGRPVRIAWAGAAPPGPAACDLCREREARHHARVGAGRGYPDRHHLRPAVLDPRGQVARAAADGAARPSPNARSRRSGVPIPRRHTVTTSSGSHHSWSPS
jgi:hypothetical protein